ncbi:MAG: domain containing protein [Acidobacteria bacterium]|nr:domain containing protein [Acidobacteriota bacterium]
MTTDPRPHAVAGDLGDFTATPRLLLISAFACGIGAISACVAWALLKLIGLFTNLFFFQRLSTAVVTPEGHTLGPLVILVPVAGALVIGVMARYGSERIRGHGIPEAIEAILINGSRIDAKVALLKPLSSAISIGSGGPFGAEGPIIMTGGAVGSLIAQFCHLTSAERKTLLVAGAAAGMSATFAAPLAAVLLAVELLLFEWKPRSLIPVALASATAAAMRRYIIGLGPLFPVPPHPVFIGPLGLIGCVLAGVLAGALSALLTRAVYASEDAFQHLPIHWMWWPAIGGLVIGIGGWLFPQALGVGYDVIGDLLKGEVSGRVILGVLIVKSIIWSVSLGSGTSGGVLAPLLMMGGALGGVEAWYFPAEGVGFWPLVSMGAILGGTMRSPLTGIVFALELTHDINMVLPLLVAATIAHGFTVLTLRRSILTEKIARRGFHLSREYAVDPLEILFVREVMRTSIAALPADAPYESLRQSLHGDSSRGRQRLYPVIGDGEELIGVVTRGDLQTVADAAPDRSNAPLAAILKTTPVVAYPDESLRVIVYRMAETGLTRFPVIDREHRRLVGMIALTDLLKARALNLDAEQRRERVLGAHITLPFGGRASTRVPRA